MRAHCTKETESPNPLILGGFLLYQMCTRRERDEKEGGMPGVRRRREKKLECYGALGAFMDFPRDFTFLRGERFSGKVLR